MSSPRLGRPSPDLLLPESRMRATLIHNPSVALALRGALLAAPLHQARAEGSDDLGVIEDLLPETELYVDIVDDGTEVIEYEGEFPVDVFDPSGAFLGTLTDGATITPSGGPGAYRFEIGKITDDWSLEVPGRTGGRVWSPDWRFDAGSFRVKDAVSRSFYALVDGGAPDRDAVVELKADGLAGYVFRISGTRNGLDGANGRSLPDPSQVYGSEYPIYLEPPEISQRNPLAPAIASLTADAGFGECGVVLPGVNDLEITVESNASGTWHLVCDLNGDTVFNLVDDADLHLLGTLEAGEQLITWDGFDNLGDAVPEGVYDCQVILAVGEFHYVGDDIETIYEGLRMFEVDSSDNRTGLTMFWNDTEVQANDINMPIGVPGPVTSGPDGVNSGDYAAAADPLVNARAWGNFRRGSKGDEAWMDTYTWVDAVESDVFQVEVGQGELDTDGDGLLDLEEDCVYGTDPNNPDTDGDGLNDRRKAINLPTDPMDPDTDGDCVNDGDEAGEGRGLPDFDNDGLVDPLDPDDDNDGIPTRDETCDLLPDEVEDGDEDGFPNRLDRDADGDLYSDIQEGVGDRDGDGRRDFLDPDTVGLGISDPSQGYYGGGCPGGGVNSTTGATPLPWMLLGLTGLLVRRCRD